eukprot:942755-Pleurochrysis_carterae.AAC.4
MFSVSCWHRNPEVFSFPNSLGQKCHVSEQNSLHFRSKNVLRRDDHSANNATRSQHRSARSGSVAAAAAVCRVDFHSVPRVHALLRPPRTSRQPHPLLPRYLHTLRGPWASLCNVTPPCRCNCLSEEPGPSPRRSGKLRRGACDRGLNV